MIGSVAEAAGPIRSESFGNARRDEDGSLG